MTPILKNKRFWFYLCGLFFWAVWISGAFGNSGIIHAYQLSKLRREMSLKVSALETERLRLSKQLNLLEHDPLTQEKAVREVLGYVRPTEIIFEFP
jgi:cell division protein FtsB